MKRSDKTERFDDEHDFVAELPKNKADLLLSALVANGLVNTQIFKYPTENGHGFAAEDANHIADKLSGKTAEVVGISNTLNGPDRAVNGAFVQSKYHASASKTIDAAFSSSSGRFRYDGQILEVPRDQYAECVKLMQDRIRLGKVPRVRNPAEAEKIVLKGSVTYKQARNIACAGNVDSLVFDAKTQSVTSMSVFAISFAVTFAQRCWHGENVEDAILTALESAIVGGGMAFVTGIVSAQVLRTQAASFGAVPIRNSVKAVSQTSVGNTLIRQVAVGSLGKSVSRTAAVNHVAKLLQTNAVTAPIATVVISSPDFYRAAFKRSISWKQFTKNLSVNAAGVAAGSAGWLGGSAAGAALGSAVPIIGTATGAVVGGVAGSLGAGIGGTVAAKSLADKIAPDDSKRLIKTLRNELARLASEYILTEGEFERIIARVVGTVDAKWLRWMFKQPHKRDFVRIEFEYLFKAALRKRARITLPSVEEFEAVMDKIYLLEETV
ncbi:MAG: hypothetical protein OYL97_24505 [Candidatus Poribacteria bacterium]|nr:hypothetical protein [Candidatus Poribacteria bacterium]